MWGKVDQIKNMEAILMCKDIKVAKLKIVDHYLVDKEILNEYYLPLEMQYLGKLDATTLNIFLSDRLMPRTRQNVNEILERLGLKEYDTEKLIRVTKGTCVDDPYWLDIIK